MNTIDYNFTDWMKPAIAPLVERWILTLLVPLGGHRYFLQANGVRHEQLGEALDLTRFHRKPEPDGQGDDKDSFDCMAALAYLRERYQASAHSSIKWTDYHPALTQNIRSLQTLLNLSELECAVLHFVLVLDYDQLLRDAAETLSVLSETQSMQVFAYLLQVPEFEIRTVLRKRAPLARAGLVQVDKCATLPFSSRFDLLTYHFSEQMMDHELELLDLLRDTVTPSDSGHLAWDAFAHMGSALDIALHTLQDALLYQRRGVNVLLYGPPGTGKTQLAKTLAKQVQIPLFDISNEDEDGDPITGERRLRALNAAQQFFKQQKVLFVFDEVEDVFNDNDDGKGKSTAEQRKAWINRTLETNEVPTIWISNNVTCMDDAFIRRYDVVLEVPIPSQQQRLQIIQHHTHQLLDEERMQIIAQADYLAPAVVSRAAQVVTRIGTDLPQVNNATVLQTLINHTLKAQGHAPLPKRLNRSGHYQPELCNTAVSLESVVDGLSRRQNQESREARLCLYGYPGTGKTAFAQHLANELDVALHIKRYSDLLSKWVGETECNIAAAFAQAEHEQAILLIDEVDGLLADRRHAEHSWETTQVNEMLTQMEQFSGVFIATTNLMDNMDMAALRRFDLKIGFDYMREEQVVMLFEQTCALLFNAAPTVEANQQVRQLRQLTPGDFAALQRRYRFSPFENDLALANALADEVRLKGGSSVTMGFLV